jgi:hypothetical protein
VSSDISTMRRRLEAMYNSLNPVGRIEQRSGLNSDSFVSNLCAFIIHQKLRQSGRLGDMAAFCACCGTEITSKAEACPICGTPRHGMLPADFLSTLDIDILSPPDLDTEGSQGGPMRDDEGRKGGDQTH